MSFLAISKSFFVSAEKLASGLTVIINSSLATAKYLLSIIEMHGSTVRLELVGNKSFFWGVSFDI
jgi:Na+/phosphate symporter